MKQSGWKRTASWTAAAVWAAWAAGIGQPLAAASPVAEVQAAAIAPRTASLTERTARGLPEKGGTGEAAPVASALLEAAKAPVRPAPSRIKAALGASSPRETPGVERSAPVPKPAATHRAPLPAPAPPPTKQTPAPPGGKSGLAVADAAVGQAMARKIAPSAEARCPAAPAQPGAAARADEPDAPPRLVCLATAFEATLTPPQREALRLPFTAKHAVSWSNRPVDEFPRNGIALGTLGEDSLEALKAMLREALSADGYDTARGIILADDKMSSAAGGNPRWGSALYHVAFLGDPSGSEPWMLQLSGRHLALNLASNTREIGLTPMFLGIEPRLFSAGGRDWAVMEPRLESMYAMLRSLPPDQMAAARLGDSRADVLLGPGKDGHFPEAEGIPYSHLGEQQKQRVRASVAAWVRTAAPASAQALLADYLSPEALERTYIGWSGSTDDRVPGSYVRIDGPRLWLETVTLAEEALPGRGHVHMVWRDRKADYGGCFF
ncbi:DUF3500 domain-containing protein [Paenibacillus albicereus]|uniref:DUF3500 domain-containing protein n=1 Tax=Paenibacillus albicereus TaxID=2726185 RepID=A0A6H2H317_9BACL|nr:DUF3500 domain-containing protein [Paenibacillus albicereus]QJC54025.1 DUF3500 domain-containing protein [Paenibacillus albicereus]